MRKLVGAVVLCVLLAVGRGGPVGNSTMGMESYMEEYKGPCYQERMRCEKEGGTCCPQCDHYGYFLPKQCSKARGCCWCVDVKTGKVIPDTETMAGSTLDCSKLSGMDTHCPYKWNYRDGRYFLFINSPMPWCEAEKFCQFCGGNLASVHSYEEYCYLQGMTMGDSHQLQETWLGAHDSVKPGFWMWCDGSKFYNEYWCHEDAAKKEGGCLKMNYGFDKKWAAANCSDPLPFICLKTAADDYMMKDSM